ncbi:MAG: cation transporter [Phycisphaerales bacterium]|nr:cation transporter [Phycisphaerales bacterium]
MSRLSLVANAGLAVVKLLAGIFGHSFALVADAIESMTDMVGSLVVWSGLRIASIPADADHPYGHGKAEPIAALIVSMMLIGAAVGIAAQAIREIIVPHHGPAAFTLWVLVGVVVVKETMYRLVRRAAKREHSSAAMADAWHHRGDALTSAAAAIGISIALLGGEGYQQADDWAALFASAIILINALRIMAAPMRELMDAEPVEITNDARKLAESVPDVVRVEKVSARKSGQRYWVDMHIEVDPDMTVQQGHALAHQVKDVVRASMPNVEDLLIHVEPAHEQKDHPEQPG